MVYYNESVPPTNDLVFKSIFWNKKYPNVLISFVNAILKRNDPITSIDLINTEMDKTFLGEHGIRLDLVGKTSNGEILNIEMQKKNNDNMYKRSLFYFAKLYSSQINQGTQYKELCPVIVINILDFNLFKDNRCHRNYILKDEKTNEEGLRMIEMHFVELKKREQIDKEDKLWAWAEFLKYPHSKELLTMKDELKEVFDARDIYDTVTSSPEQQEKIRLIEKAELDREAFLAAAHEEGLQKGKEEGAHEKAIETARNFLKMGLSVEQVAKGTGLSIDEINVLKKDF